MGNCKVQPNVDSVDSIIRKILKLISERREKHFEERTVLLHEKAAGLNPRTVRNIFSKGCSCTFPVLGSLLNIFDLEMRYVDRFGFAHTIDYNAPFDSYTLNTLLEASQALVISNCKRSCLGIISLSDYLGFDRTTVSRMLKDDFGLMRRRNNYVYFHLTIWLMTGNTVEIFDKKTGKVNLKFSPIDSPFLTEI